MNYTPAEDKAAMDRLAADMDRLTSPRPKRSIGDVIWIPRVQLEQVEEQCPDCLGTARWHVVLPSGEEFDCECCRCYHGGFEPSNGRIREKWRWNASAIQVEITGAQVRNDSIEYSTVCGNVMESDTFDTEDEALVRSQEKGERQRNAEYDRLHKIATSKGRPRKDPVTGARQANDMDFGGRSIAYAKSQVRRSIEEAFRWINYAARRGATIDICKVIEDHKAKENPNDR